MLAKSIKNFFTKISNGVKDHQADIILLIGVILISLLSFALGFILAKQQEKEPIKIEYYEKYPSTYRFISRW